MLKNAERFMELESIKEDKVLEITYLLDLFAGQLTLSDIMNTEIPLLNEMINAKRKIIQAQKENTPTQ